MEILHLKQFKKLKFDFWEKGKQEEGGLENEVWKQR